MENEKNIIEEKKWETPEDYWCELMRLAEEDDPAGVEYLLLHRSDFKNGKIDLSKAKIPGEEELFAWLQGRAENVLGRKLQVEMNEEGIIVPIENKNKEE